jgi:ATP-dependent DNA helicase RecQ
VGANIKADAWRPIFRQLVAAGFLYVDMNEYGALKLTAAAPPVLKGKQRVELRRRILSPAKRVKEQKRPRVVAEPDAALLPEARDLFERLRRWRFETAKEQGVPAYVIFHDKTLKEIAHCRPANREALMTVPGVGQAKMERYGEAILRLACPAP